MPRSSLAAAILAATLALPAAPAQALDCTVAVRRVIVETTGANAARLAPSARLDRDLAIRGFDRVRLLAAMADAFGFDVGAADADRLVTVADLTALVERSAKVTGLCRR